MKKDFLALRCAIVFAIVLLFSDCSKPDQDYPHYCQILRFVNTSTEIYNNYTADFQYDSKGTPQRITRTNTGTGMPNYLFRHDKYNRVTDVIGSYGNGDNGDVFEFWYRLKYDAKNRVILDSSFYNGIIGNNPGPIPGVSLLILVHTHEYDAQNRIIRSHRQESSGYQDRYYYYNHKGNLDSTVIKWDDGSQYIAQYGNYDDKINIRRTNPLWQYLDRNYSKNNSFNTITSNRYGLPTTVEAPAVKDNPVYFLTFSIDNMNIQYSCK